MKTTWFSSLFVGFAILFIGACGQEQKYAAEDVKDQPSALNYFSQFKFNRSIKPPGANYAQSGIVPANAAGNETGHYKVNLFLLDEQKYVLEYTELTNEDPNSKKGTFHSVVIEGKWVVAPDLKLMLDDGKVAEGVKQKTDEQNNGILLTIKANLHDRNGALKFKPEKVILTQKGSTRLALPTNSPTDLAKRNNELEREGKPQGFQD